MQNQIFKLSEVRKPSLFLKGFQTGKGVGAIQEASSV